MQKDVRNSGRVVPSVLLLQCLTAKRYPLLVSVDFEEERLISRQKVTLHEGGGVCLFSTGSQQGQSPEISQIFFENF
jgi:hypothetical protein